ncbi:YraN family protein [Pontibacterium sp.]|jgi:putative endonuclease|uniref:YraN family protein n=1 Tax=Pontibacterium sp. TaxID=2036026 RepID=UPI0035693782
MDRNKLGKDAERSARKHLERSGLTTLTTNYNCRAGEIDLIMQEQLTLIFVEVRLRQHKNFGSAAESVNIKKQKKIIQAARYFLLQNPQYAEQECRFDVLAFDSTEALSTPLWYKDAFRL